VPSNAKGLHEGPRVRKPVVCLYSIWLDWRSGVRLEISIPIVSKGVTLVNLNHPGPARQLKQPPRLTSEAVGTYSGSTPHGRRHRHVMPHGS
jgi:hypothetical protein